MSGYRFLSIGYANQYQSIDFYWFLFTILIEINNWFLLIGIVGVVSNLTGSVLGSAHDVMLWEMLIGVDPFPE